MQKKCTNNNQDNLFRIIFFSYSLSLMELLLCQPFHDITRFCLYSSIIAIGIILFCIDIKSHRLVFNAASFLLLSTEVWTAFLLFTHKEFMVYGLAAIINIFLFIWGLCQISSDDLLKEALIVTRVIMYTTLFIVIISLTMKPLLEHFPEIKDTNLFGKPFPFNDLANTYDYRIKGYAHHPNQTGMICSTAIISSIFIFLFSNTKVDTIISIINITLNFLFLILASSRSPLVATAAFAIAFIIYYYICTGLSNNPINKKIISVFFVCLIFLLIVLALCLFNEKAKEYILHKIIRVQNIKTATGRTNLQKTILKEYVTQKHYILGISRSHILNITDTLGAHNTFVELISAKGIFSLLLFIGGIFAELFYSIKLLFCRKEISNEDRKLMAFSFGMIFATIVQNSFESAYLYELTGVAPFERWTLCIPIIVWSNYKKKHKILIHNMFI